MALPCSFLRRWGLAWCPGFLSLVLATICAPAAPPKRVLVIHSFGSAAPPFTTHSTAFEKALTEEMREPVDLDEVSLDMARYADLDMEEALIAYMQKRRDKWQPDLVVPIGSPAGIFVAQFRERLYPKTPVVYCGLDRRRLPPDALQKNAAFVGEDFNLPGFVEDMLQIAPATTNIAVVIGASPLEHFWADAFRREFEPFTNRVGFTWLNNLSFDQMLERVSELPPRSFVFLILLMRDAAGVTHNADEALKRIHEVANAPVNGIFQHQLGLGIVGGRLYQAEREGVEAARMAVRILRGEPASNFPPVIVGPLEPRYDWRELQRWEIGPEQLSPGGTVLFRVPTAWEQHRVWIITGIVLFVVEALLIFGLLANLFKRRHAEQSLRESENRLRSILETAVEGIITINDRGGIESVNTAAEKLFGYTAAEMVGQPVTLFLPSPIPEEHQNLASYLRSGESRIIGSRREVSGRRKDGSVFPMDLSVSEVALAGRRVFTGLVRDITERRLAERASRELSGRLISAQEAERARLARELHDDITQRLAVLAIDAGRAEHAGNGSVPVETMRSVREGLVRLSEDVHSLSYKLHPSLLDDLGLAAAIKAECESFARREALRCDVVVSDLPEGLPREMALGLFRIAQEALRNAARHARPGFLEVTLRRLDDGLQLAIRDNGAGFDPSLKRNRASIGLAGMTERAQLLGGELDIDSTPGHGTTIVAWVPLKGQRLKAEGQSL